MLFWWGFVTGIVAESLLRFALYLRTMHHEHKESIRLKKGKEL